MIRIALLISHLPPVVLASTVFIRTGINCRKTCSLEGLYCNSDELARLSTDAYACVTAIKQIYSTYFIVAEGDYSSTELDGGCLVRMSEEYTQTVDIRLYSAQYDCDTMYNGDNPGAWSRVCACSCSGCPQPSGLPSGLPSSDPTSVPTQVVAPSGLPTVNPFEVPTVDSSAPTVPREPTPSPTSQEVTTAPTMDPSQSPNPSGLVTSRPTTVAPAPVAASSSPPTTPIATAAPSAPAPASASDSPAVSREPSTSPAGQAVSAAPTMEEVNQSPNPSGSPATCRPTEVPTVDSSTDSGPPTGSPVAQSRLPTASPTVVPTLVVAPSGMPTVNPFEPMVDSSAPTLSSRSPTVPREPTPSPTSQEVPIAPTMDPTGLVTSRPTTAVPTSDPFDSQLPTASPTVAPAPVAASSSPPTTLIATAAPSAPAPASASDSPAVSREPSTSPADQAVTAGPTVKLNRSPNPSRSPTIDHSTAVPSAAPLLVIETESPILAMRTGLPSRAPTNSLRPTALPLNQEAMLAGSSFNGIGLDCMRNSGSLGWGVTLVLIWGVLFCAVIYSCDLQVLRNVSVCILIILETIVGALQIATVDRTAVAWVVLGSLSDFFIVIVIFLFYVVPLEDMSLPPPKDTLFCLLTLLVIYSTGIAIAVVAFEYASPCSMGYRLSKAVAGIVILVGAIARSISRGLESHQSSQLLLFSLFWGILAIIAAIPEIWMQDSANAVFLYLIDIVECGIGVIVVRIAVTQGQQIPIDYSHQSRSSHERMTLPSVQYKRSRSIAESIIAKSTPSHESSSELRLDDSRSSNFRKHPNLFKSVSFKESEQSSSSRTDEEMFASIIVRSGGDDYFDTESNRGEIAVRSQNRSNSPNSSNGKSSSSTESSEVYPSVSIVRRQGDFSI